MIRNLADQANRRTIVSAVNPRRFADSYTEILLKVWFEELDRPVEVVATPFDCERHSKELWIRAMAGEYGSIEVLPEKLGDRRPVVIIDMNHVHHVALVGVVDHRLEFYEPKRLPSPPRQLTFRG